MYEFIKEVLPQFVEELYKFASEYEPAIQVEAKEDDIYGTFIMMFRSEDKDDLVDFYAMNFTDKSWGATRPTDEGLEEAEYAIYETE